MQSLLERQGKIWIDGNYFDWQDAKIHILSQTFHTGFGVFEGIRSYAIKNGSAIFRLYEHTERLFNSAKILGIQVPYTFDQLIGIQKEIIKLNRLNNAYIRPMIYLDGEFIGLHSQISTVRAAVIAFDWGNLYANPEKLKKGLSIKTSSYRRLNINSVLLKAKANGLYINSILANNEARIAGYDDALILDEEGFVAEGSGANIFMVKKGIIHTPEVTAALEGITRDSILQIACDLNYEVQIRRITRDEFYTADEVFFTGTAAEVMPITKIDDRQIGSGFIGEVTAQLQQKYFSIVTGNEPNYFNWLSQMQFHEMEEVLCK